jgi:hypothetical protein
MDFLFSSFKSLQPNLDIFSEPNPVLWTMRILKFEKKFFHFWENDLWTYHKNIKVKQNLQMLFTAFIRVFIYLYTKINRSVT